VGAEAHRAGIRDLKARQSNRGASSADPTPVGECPMLASPHIDPVRL
jgi:hypothetical protein